MQKLKNSILNKLIAAHATNNEIVFMVYISRFQNNEGVVTGVHYKDVCAATNMSYQGYYDVKESLEKKSIIHCEKNDRSDCDIIILDNQNEKCRKEGYINTNHNIFFCEEFYKLRAGAKLLAMHMMKVSDAGKGYFEIGVEKFYDEENGYPKRFGVSARVMRSYLMEIKTLFSIGIRNGKYYIEPRKVIYKKSGEKGEAERYREFGTNVVLRRSHIKEPGDGEKEIYKLFKQYDSTVQELKKDLVKLMDRAIKRSLQILNKGERWIKNKTINIKLVHKLLREEIYESDTDVEIALQAKTSVSEKDEARTITPAVENKHKGNFHKFNQREYDYDELERLLLNASPVKV